jgi:hypothetical protein
MSDDADRIWHRACNPDYEPVRPGDRALYDVLAFHGLSMNGGVIQPLEVDFALATKAAAGYRHFGAEHLASLVDEAAELAGPAVDGDGNLDFFDLDADAVARLEALDARLPDDAELEEVFRRHLAEHPDEFDPA